MDNNSTQQSSLLNPQQARFVYLFGGLFPIITSIVTPLSVYRKVLKKPNASDVQRYNDLLQEVSRQLVSGSIGLLSYFSGGAIANGLQKLFHKNKDDEDGSQNTSGSQYVRMFIGGHLLSFVGYSFIRPAIQTDLLYLVRLKEGEVGQKPASQHPGWQGKVRRWVEHELVPNGQPQLKKTALLSVLGLGAYLGGLGMSICAASYGLSKMGKNKADKIDTDKPTSPIAKTNGTQTIQFGQTHKFPSREGWLAKPDGVVFTKTSNMPDFNKKILFPNEEPPRAIAHPSTGGEFKVLPYNRIAPLWRN